MASTEERVTALEFDLKQFRTETIKAYTDMAYEMTIVKGLEEDSIKRLAALRTEMQEFRVEVNNRFERLDTRIDGMVGQLALVLQKLDKDN
jgi:ferritin-like protein